MIAAALSIQDPRAAARRIARRPTSCTAASTSPARTCCRSSPCGTTCGNGSGRCRTTSSAELCRAEHLNYLRVREWQDLFSQLRQVAGDLGVRPGTEAGHPDRVHQSVLTGLLSHLGMRDRTGRDYLGARGARFVIAPGSVLFRRGARWVMAAELVETDRLRARRVAAIQPEWAEQAAAHLVERVVRRAALGRPPRRGRDHGDGDAVRPADRDRPCRRLRPGRSAGRPRDVHPPRPGRGRLDDAPRLRPPATASSATTSGRWRPASAAPTCSTTTTSTTLFDRRVGADVVSTRHFDRWWRDAERADPHRLDLTEDVLDHGAGIRMADYPDTGTRAPWSCR